MKRGCGRKVSLALPVSARTDVLNVKRMEQPQKPFQPKAPEREFDGPIWKHPYMVYVLLTAVLFVGLVIAAYLALKNGWLPTR